MREWGGRVGSGVREGGEGGRASGEGGWDETEVRVQRETVYTKCESEVRDRVKCE